MKTEMLRPRDKAFPIVEIDEFWTPAWEIEAVEATLISPGYRVTLARAHDAFEAFDD